MRINKSVKNFIKASIFIFSFIPVFIHVSYMRRQPIAHTTSIRTGFYAEKKNSLDIVFIGTSGTFSAFCPMEAFKNYGFTSYNFCTNIMGADTFVYALKEVLKYQKPKVIILDVYPFVIHNMVSECNSESEEYIIRYNTDGYRYSLNRMNLIRSIVPNTYNKNSFYFDILYYGLGNLDTSQFNFASHNFKKGYNSLPWEEGHPALITEKEKTLEENYDKCLNEILDYCKKIKVPVLFLYYPYGNTSEDSIEYVNYIKRKVIENDFDFLNCEDFIDEFNFDYMIDFWGESHWNIFGAEKITSVVSQKLVEKYNLTDKRKDKKYLKWNDEISDWENYVQEEKKYVINDKNEKCN